MIHPLNIEIKLDFDKQEKYGFDGNMTSWEDCPPLVYSISNLEEDVFVNFFYKNDSIRYQDRIVEIENPFKVCLKDDCQENVKNFKFRKGNDYKIYLKIQHLINQEYWIPAFSFEKTDVF